MKAAVLFEPNAPLQIENVSVRKPKSHEVLLRTSFAGICLTDLHYMEAHTPYMQCPLFWGTSRPASWRRLGTRSDTQDPAITS